MPWPDKFYWVKRNIRNDHNLDHTLEQIDKGQLKPATTKEGRKVLTPKREPPKPRKWPWPFGR